MTVVYFLHIFTFPTYSLQVRLRMLLCFLLTACWRRLCAFCGPLESHLNLWATLGASLSDLGVLPGRTLGFQVGLFGRLGLQVGLQALQVGFLGQFGASSLASWASFGPPSWSEGSPFKFRFFDHIYQSGEADCAERLNIDFAPKLANIGPFDLRMNPPG